MSVTIILLLSNWRQKIPLTAVTMYQTTRHHNPGDSNGNEKNDKKEKGKKR
jgi:hypothetical protein